MTKIGWYSVGSISIWAEKTDVWDFPVWYFFHPPLFSFRTWDRQWQSFIKITIELSRAIFVKWPQRWVNGKDPNTSSAIFCVRSVRKREQIQIRKLDFFSFHFIKMLWDHLFWIMNFSSQFVAVEIPDPENVDQYCIEHQDPRSYHSIYVVRGIFECAEIMRVWLFEMRQNNV